MNGRFDRWATILMLLVGGLLLLVPLGSFITQDTWPQLFEVGAHHIPMRDWPSWLRAGQTVGWDHTFFNGHPTYQFYFPAPALGWMLLDVVLPAHTAYILVTVLPIPAILWAAYWLARSWSLGRPSAALFAASAILYGANGCCLPLRLPRCWECCTGSSRTGGRWSRLCASWPLRTVLWEGKGGAGGLFARVFYSLFV